MTLQVQESFRIAAKSLEFIGVTRAEILDSIVGVLGQGNIEFLGGNRREASRELNVSREMGVQ